MSKKCGERIDVDEKAHLARREQLIAHFVDGSAERGNSGAFGEKLEAEAVFDFGMPSGADRQELKLEGSTLCRALRKVSAKAEVAFS